MFAYLAAFVSIILALAVSDLVQSLHRLLRARQRVKWSLTALIATATVFMAILEEFFGLWRFTGVERFTYFDLLTLIVPAILLSIAAMTVFRTKFRTKVSTSPNTTWTTGGFCTCSRPSGSLVSSSVCWTCSNP